LIILAWTDIFTSQAFVIVITGVTVFVIGQILVRFLIEPYQLYRAAIGEITEGLIFYADVYSNPGALSIEETTRAREHTRRLSASLQSRVTRIPWYRIWQYLPWLPTKKEIDEASGLLIRLSNSTQTSAAAHDPHGDVKRIKTLLKF
jgi:hypothetical protein